MFGKYICTIFSETKGELLSMGLKQLSAFFFPWQDLFVLTIDMILCKHD